MGAAVEIRAVSKRFRLHHERYTSLKERVIHFGRVPYEEFWALRDIDVDVAAGETLGMLGHNGSGKSTLLKCIAGILQPTKGEIRTVGRLAALLELGAGFHPELTGRENIFLNGSILGLSRREIEKRFDEIVGFAELEPFIDNQVKYYSSGMYMRLGFAVAINVDPEILLVDEVLAVGDELFQRKCLDRVKQLQREGRTILFVSHAADMVRAICDRVMVLDHGNLVTVGNPAEAVRSFREHLLQRQRFEEAEQLVDGPLEITEHGTAQERRRNFRVRITGVSFQHDGNANALTAGGRLRVAIGYERQAPVDDVVFGITVYDPEDRVLYGTNTDLLGINVGPLSETGEVAFSFDTMPLADGSYPVTIGVHSRDDSVVYDWREQGFRFDVVQPDRSAGLLSLPVTFTAD